MCAHVCMCVHVCVLSVYVHVCICTTVYNSVHIDSNCFNLMDGTTIR